MDRTDLGGWGSAGGYGSSAFVTGSFTPPANSLLLVVVGMMLQGGGGDVGEPTIAGGGLTFSLVGSARSEVSWARRVNVFSAPVGASPSSMTLTIDDNNNQSIYSYNVAVIAYEGHDEDTPIVGFVGSGTGNIGDGGHMLTLGAAPAVDDESVIVLAGDANANTLNPAWASGWTEIFEVGVASGGAMIAVAGRAGSTSTAADVTDVYQGGGGFFNASMIAFVVKAAPAGGITVTPAAAVVRGVVVNPIVILGAITITPAPAVARGVAVNPIVILGAITITPAPAVARVITINPTVIGGEQDIPPLGQGDTDGFIIFMLSSAIYNELTLAGLGAGLQEPSEANAAFWSDYLFGS